MLNEKISVLLSIFNNEKTIEFAILSILNQTYENIELLIMDDCSTDSSPIIVEKYLNLDKRVKFYKNKKNIGLTKSLNILLENTDGYYIARQDADDISFLERFEKQLKYINENNLDGCSTRAVIKNSLKITPKKSYYLNKRLVLKIKNPFVHGSLLMKKEVLDKIGGYDNRFYFAQDYKLINDLIKSNYKIGILKTPLYLLNLENNISTNFKNEQKYYSYCVRNNLDPKD